jgi:hypothetical protein
MYVHFVLYVIAIVLVAIFWELSKINSRLKKALGSPSRPQDEPPRQPK